MPKACHLITRLILGGAQRLALETALHAAATGWEIELWAGPQTGPEGSLAEEARARGLRVRIIPTLRREVSPWADLCAYRLLCRQFRAERFDLVHTHSAKAGILGRHAAAEAGVGCRIHSIHGWSMTPETSWGMRRLYAQLERAAAPKAHKLIAVSTAVRDAGLAAGIGRPEQYTVIHGAVTPPEWGASARAACRQELGLPPDAIVLGTLGRLDDAKNPLGAFRAIAPILASDRRIRAVFIGAGHLRPALERAIARSGVRDQVILAGLVPGGARLLPALDIFFLASRWEGFPLVLIEAMFAQLPVVAFDIAGIPEAIAEGRTGLLAPPEDQGAFRRAIERLVAQPELRRTMGRAGCAQAQSRFAMDRMLQETLDLYASLLHM